MSKNEIEANFFYYNPNLHTIPKEAKTCQPYQYWFGLIRIIIK